MSANVPIYVNDLAFSTNRRIQEMSDLWINWRFGVRHLHIGPSWPYVSFRVNQYHVTYPPKKWFETY